jgi:hypothetical protein
MLTAIACDARRFSGMWDIGGLRISIQALVVTMPCGSGWDLCDGIVDGAETSETRAWSTMSGLGKWGQRDADSGSQVSVLVDQ